MQTLQLNTLMLGGSIFLLLLNVAVLLILLYKNKTTKEHVTLGKTLTNTTAKGARTQVKDIEFWGNGNMFRLLSKASSPNEGWMKSTKAMEIKNVGCLVQTTTQQRNVDLTYSLCDALQFVPNVKIVEVKDENNKVTSRNLEKI